MINIVIFEDIDSDAHLLQSAILYAFKKNGISGDNLNIKRYRNYHEYLMDFGEESSSIEAKCIDMLFVDDNLGNGQLNGEEIIDKFMGRKDISIGSLLGISQQCDSIQKKYKVGDRMHMIGKPVDFLEFRNKLLKCITYILNPEREIEREMSVVNGMKLL